MAERVGFEPTVRQRRTLDFESYAYMHGSPENRMDIRLLDARTVRKNTKKAYRVAKNPQSTEAVYHVPASVLNIAAYGATQFHPHDAIYTIPDEWLMANASRFYFADQQIIDEAKDQFQGAQRRVMRQADYPPVSGIYFLIRNKRIVYVGISNYIARRMFQHHGNGLDFDSMSWFEAPVIYQKTIEAYYIRRINPPRNTDNPGHMYFDRCVENIGNPVTPTLAPYLRGNVTQANDAPPRKRSGSAKYYADKWLRIQAETQTKRAAEALLIKQ